MGKPTGFMEFARCEPGYRSKAERVHDFNAVELLPEAELILEQSARCMDCGVPFCHAYGCPLANLIPEWNDAVYRGCLPEALELLLATNNFPEFTGRICPAPCEAACVCGLNGEAVTIRQMEVYIAEKAFELGLMKARPPSVRRDERVAVIGSGPAGLAVADSLNRMGFRVVVYDSAAHAGGILRYGIPEFKLEKRVVDRRVRLMESEGVVFELGVRVGEDVSMRYLQSRFDAVCLSGGAREPRDLKAPGRELAGVHFALEYLRQMNCRCDGESITAAERIDAAGQHVVVIGGGDTGSDCVGTALRQGAASVRQYEILPEPPSARAESTPWPLWPLQRRDSSSHKEGGERRWNVSTKALLGEAGHVTALLGVEVEWITAADGGRPQMRERPGSEFSVPADLVLLAMGFVGPRSNRLFGELDVTLDARGNVARNERNMTSVPGVFVAGDMTNGASLVVRAIADGRRAADGVRDYLERRTGMAR